MKQTFYSDRQDAPPVSQLGISAVYRFLTPPIKNPGQEISTEEVGQVQKWGIQVQTQLTKCMPYILQASYLGNDRIPRGVWSILVLLLYFASLISTWNTSKL